MYKLKNNIKMIISDLDGTLLRDGATRVSCEMLDMIIKMDKLGIRFTAASGRSYDNLRFLFSSVAERISYICDNGSVCFHENKPIYENFLDEGMCVHILQEVKKFPGCDVFVACRSGVFTDSDNEDFWQFMKKNSYYMMKKVDDLSMLGEPLYKIALFTRNEAEKLKNYFEKLCVGKLYVKRTGETWVDFINPKATKGDALKALGEALGIHPMEMMAFGDRFNDVEMLEYAGTSFAMIESEKGLNEHVSGVTKTVEEQVEKLINAFR